ncbi:tRNA splicing endonuclease subunit [Purpureocillium lavendulum]|uniref:tRNA splicing endonuclease subunit n=1 Tax=Purpureocillium lavendulum TaxID=1247861 RepID=A0AB34FMW7_9HYPO|nr:tRNA splicing endonuclease subunit [Purpureocillium lavendulum]
MEEPVAEKRGASASAPAEDGKPTTNHSTASPAPSAGAAAESDAATQAGAAAEREVAAAKAAAEQQQPQPQPQQKRREPSPQQDRPQAPTPPAEPRPDQDGQSEPEARSYERSTSRPLVQSPEREPKGDQEQPPKQEQPNGTSADTVQLNGRKTNGATEDGEVESELSDPDSNLHSPTAAAAAEPEDEIVVEARADKEQKPADQAPTKENEDSVMEDAQDEAAVSHYPKRKRTSLYPDLSETKMENSQTAPAAVPTPPPARDTRKTRTARETSVKAAMLGSWRDSPVPEPDRRHAVIGFIDVRDRLRTRVQPHTMTGVPIDDYRLPPGPGGSWVTFERIVFLDHLVGLDHSQIKEFVRCVMEQTDDLSTEELIEVAKVRARENPAYDNPVVAPSIAYGQEMPERGTNRPDSKRRKTSNGFAPINTNVADSSTPGPDSAKALTPPHSMAAHQTRFSVDPLPGTRPTRILLGYWRPSSESDPKDRHAVYGILGQNDMFRVKVVRETRDGRFVDGNFPVGAGALWIQYEEVEMEDHLKALQRSEIKEYCRVRQYQLDKGETPEERAENEAKAVVEAQVRANNALKPGNNASVPSFGTVASTGADTEASPRPGHGGHELRQSRRIEPRPDGRNLRHSLNENDLRSTQQRSQAPVSNNAVAVERTNAMARRELARAEAAQIRADRHANNRERAAAAAAAADAATAAAAAAAASTPMPLTNGRVMFHESDDVQRLNDLWERQETLRVKAGAEDAKFYDGVKYERKPTGPFIGKLVSQGTIINIDGEDYVEYRVLTKPSFF